MRSRGARETCLKTGWASNSNSLIVPVIDGSGMRFEFPPEEWIRSGNHIYDSDTVPPDSKYVLFNHPLRSRPDRPVAVPIPPISRVVDLGCGTMKEKGSVGLDIAHVSGIDVQCDIFKAIPLRDHSVDMVWAHQFFEHIPHQIGTQKEDGLFCVLREVRRILKIGGILRLDVPHAYYPGAFWDPTHTRFFLPQTFNYFEPEYSLGHYSNIKFRVLALRLSYGVTDSTHFNEFHIKRYTRAGFARNALRAILGARILNIYAILQSLP